LEQLNNLTLERSKFMATERYWIVKENNEWRAEREAFVGEVSEQAWEQQIGKEQFVTFKNLDGVVWSELTAYVLVDGNERKLIELA
jgi:hypothetical protein